MPRATPAAIMLGFAAGAPKAKLFMALAGARRRYYSEALGTDVLRIEAEMIGIKAFVGHSFAAEDRELVRTFIDHFKTLAKAYPGFTWDHAEEAEPKPLSEKVLMKIQDKNVFIGICTRGECVVGRKNLTRARFNRSTLKTTEQQVQWKTSDWIIQEIGLALGRTMSIILFLEEGVREPGGLFGEIEYIRFSRETPHSSFDKLLEMLTALAPKDTAAAAVSGETKASTTEVKTELEEPADNREPKPNWTEMNYDEAVTWAIVMGDQAGFDQIDKAFRESPFGAEAEAIPVWDAKIEVYKMLFDKRGDLEKIKQLSDKYPNNSSLLGFKARGFKELREHDRAARAYEEAAALAKKDNSKARFLANAAIEYAHARTKERALEIVERIKREVPPSEPRQLMLLEVMRDFARIDKDDSLQIIVLEQLSELRPGDSAKRFALAYEHSDAGSKDMALHHYVKLPIGERNSTTWNNLGVSFGEFGMPVKAIDAFETSANENETLAMSNLGFKLLAAGFLKEAKALCDKALALGKYHQNIPSLARRIIEVPQEENKTLDETLEKTTDKASFYRKLGAAVLEPAPTVIGPQWKGSEGILRAAIGGDTLTLTGTFERPSLGGLLSLGLGAGSLAPTVRSVTHRTSFVGEIRGRVVIGQVTRKSDGDDPSLLSEAMSGVKVLMYFNDDHTELSVMENPQSATPQFYKIRQEGLSAAV